MTKDDNLHVCATLTSERDPYPLKWKLSDTHSRSGKFGEEKILLTLLRLEPRFLNWQTYIIFH